MSTQDLPKSSGCARIALVLFALVGFGVALLCAGLGGSLWWGLELFNPSLDPRTGLQVSRNIADIDFPKDLAPRFSIRMGSLGVDGVFCESGKGREGLLLSQATDAKHKGEFQKQVEQAGKGGVEGFEITKTTDREFTVRGTKTNFHFAEGKIRKSNVAFRQVTGEFPGKHGTANFVYYITADKYDEERVLKLIESIH